MNFLEKYGLKIILILFLTFSYSITAESKKLLILGDSISAGYGLKKSENWVQLLEASLRTSGKELQIINSSISGDTTIGGLSRIESDLKQYRPNYVLVELGGNDALRGYPIDKIKHNLIKIVDASLEAGAYPIIMQIRIPPNYGKNYVAAFESIYSEIAQAKSIPKISFLLEKVALDKDLMQLDGIHPNQKAQKIIAEQVKKELLNIFK
ncbi:arylesterase [Gammaproteobacteria bacterium]|nr:arylesterase [Gammaproteobacteria bacterium]